MSLKMIQVLEYIFAVLAAVGLFVILFLVGSCRFVVFYFLGFDTWRCLRVGEISTGPSWKWYGFTFSRDESP
jgi:hypothetical protein